MINGSNFGGTTDVTYTSYGEKMRASCAGVCIGFLLFFGSFGLLFWNEGRAVRRQEDLDEGRGIVQQVGLTTINATIDKIFDSKLVFITGLVDGGNDVIYDDLFNLNVTNATGGALKYGRNVEVYLWKERSETRTEKTSGGGTRQYTTYSYDRVWSPTLISSGSFREAVTPQNPSSYLVSPASFASNDIGLGPFRLHADIISQIDWETLWTNAPINGSMLTFTGYTTTYTGGTMMIKQQSSIDTIGDHRVTFSIVMPDYISVVARQGSSGQLEPYITSGDRELLLFGRGSLSSDALFNQAEEDNNNLTWILRFVGFIVQVIGICLVLNPLAAAFDVLPFCGDALEGCIGGCIIPCIALCISIPCSLFVISIAWIFYRPYFAIGSLVMLGLLGFLYVKYLKPKLSKPPPAQQSNPAGKPNQGFNEGFGGQPHATAVPMGGYEQQHKEEPYSGQYMGNPPPPAYNDNKGDFANALNNPPPAQNPGFSPPPSYPPPSNTGGGGYVAP